MSNKTKIYWTTQQVYNYLKNKTGKLELPNDVYFSEDFKWNEVLKTNDKFFQMPSMEILENLKVLFNVVQKYRSFIGREFTINSSWRSPAEQKDLIEQYNKGKLETKPSETSLHMEGLAVDITVEGSQKDFQKLVNDTFVGEAEFGSNYTHLGLTTFSKTYLQRHGLFRDDIYRKLVLDTTKLPKAKRDYIEKRIDPPTWNRLDSTFDPVKNREMFSELNQTDNCDLNNKNLEEDTLFSIKPNSLPKYFDIDKLIDKKVEDSVKVQKGKTTGFAADLSEDSSSYDSGTQNNNNILNYF